MNFSIKLVRLYFSARNFKDYVFEPNMINVVTGDSGTGKTSIMSIIDYCLLSSKNNIPYEIELKTSWFLISFVINGKKWSIGRKSPRDGVSGEVYFSDGDIDVVINNNTNIEELKNKINHEFGISNSFEYPLDLNYFSDYTEISFRDFLLFNMLSESIIGAKDKYWDTEYFGNDNFEGKLNILFELALGVSSLKKIKAKEKLEKINVKMNKIKTAEKNKNKYNERLDKLYLKCRDEGFIHDDSLSFDKLDIISKGIDRTKNLIFSNDYNLEIEYLEEQLYQIKFELNVLEKYKRQYRNYKNNLDKNADSLEPVQFLKSKLDNQLLKTVVTDEFISVLETSLNEIRLKSQSLVIDNEFSDDDYIILKEQQNDVKKRLDEIKKIQFEIDSFKKKAFILGELSIDYTNLMKEYKTKNKNQDILTEKHELLEYKKALEHIVEDKSDDVLGYLNNCIQLNYDNIETLKNYKDYKVLFDVSKKQLTMKPNSEQLQFQFTIDNIGSKSNNMFLHLCTFLGFHEHFISLNPNYVSNFLFIDQPSIPYYYGGGKSKDDRKKLIDAFKLINSFMKRILSKTDFQIILIEHAPRSYWEENNLNYFHVVSEFVDGNALIPLSIFEG